MSKRLVTAATAILWAIAVVLSPLTDAQANLVQIPSVSAVFACDTIIAGCNFAYSVSSKLVAAYPGKAFQLVNMTPTWTGTGTVAAGVLTISTTITGTPAIGNAVSTAGSGATPGFKPVTYISGGSGPYNLSDNSITIASPTAMAAYAVLDVGFTGGSWDTTTWQAFCYNSTCGFLKVYNEGTATATGTLTGTDLVAAEVHTGAGGVVNNCAASIVVCAPLFTIYTPTNTPLIQAATPGWLSINAGAVSGVTLSGSVSGTGSKSIQAALLNLYTTNCCGGLGIGDFNPNSVVAGSMFSESFNAIGTDVYGDIDIEGAGTGNIYDTGMLQHGVIEIQFDGGANKLTSIFDGSAYAGPTAPPATINTSNGFFNIGSGGDYTQSSQAVEAVWISPDSVSHTTAYNKLATYWTGRSASACAGPLDLTWQPGPTAMAPGSLPYEMGNSWGAWSLRPLSAWYTGPIVNVTNNAAQTQTFSAVGCNIDPALQAFCTGGNAPCQINTLYNQSLFFGAPAAVNAANVYTNINFNMAAAGAARPTIDYVNTLGGQPTINGSGTQLLCTPAFSSAVSTPGTRSVEFSVLWMRTGGTSATSVSFAGSTGSTNNIRPQIYNDTANTVGAFYNGTAVADEAANDNHWQEVDWKIGAAAGAGTFYLNGVGTAAGSTSSATTQTNFCLFSRGTVLSAPLTGNIAQAFILRDDAAFNNANANHAAAILANDQAYYGVTFPH